MRTVHEYAELGDVVDVSSGLGTTRRELEKPNDAVMRKKMTVTKEVRDILLDWLRDILSPEVRFRGKSGQRRMRINVQSQLIRRLKSQREAPRIGSVS